MKKLMAMTLILLLLLSLAACGGNSNKKNIVGVWHVVDETLETDYGLGIEFTKDGKVRYGLTEDVFTALADGDKKDAETAMKALDLLISMEYKLVSETQMEITAKALMGLKKETTTVDYLLEGDTLTFDGTLFARVTEDGTVAVPQKAVGEETAVDPQPEETSAPVTEDVPEYDPGAWLQDNTSISFYFLYSEDKEDNELCTLKVRDGKAVLYSKVGDGEERPTTIYEETGEGVVVTALLYSGDRKGAVVDEPREGYTLKTFLPKVGTVLATFGLRADRDPYRNQDPSGQSRYIGRECYEYGESNIAGANLTYVDKETGIVLKSATTMNTGSELKEIVSVWVTELSYGKVKKQDVEVDLSGYEVSVVGEEAGSKTLAYFRKYLSGGEYTMEMKTSSEGMTITSKNVYKGDMVYSESCYDDTVSSVLMKDGYQYIIDHDAKTVMKLSALESSVQDIFADEEANYETPSATGTEELDGVTYNYEEFSPEGETVRYLFLGEELKFIKASVMGVESTVELISMESGADASLFEIPADYAVTEIITQNAQGGTAYEIR